MEDKNIQFLQKLDSLPEEVNLYFSSNLDEKNNLEISKEYNIDISSLIDLVINFFVSDFNLDILSKEAEGKNINMNILNNFICDFLGKLFLPVGSFLSWDVKKEIESRKGKIEKYKTYVDEFNNLIEDKNLEELSELTENFMKEFDEAEEERVVLNFLEKDLLSVLSDDDISGPQKINGSLIYLLINKKDSLNKFIRTFLINQEQISSQRILLDGKEQDPTIANWIKHFVKENGSGIPGNIALAKYLTSSPDVLSLKEDEKKILKKVLKLYKNLVFFPDSMSNIPRDDWEIIPVDRDSNFVNKNIDEKNTVVQDIKKSIKDNKPAIKKEEIKVEKKAELKNEEIKINETIKEAENPEIIKLQEMLAKYPEGSLERRAIESEIKKISNKQSK
ncbi:MAG TPA: hypothetical protein PK142_01560 [bacterium]|nr:hypothetical protein [bacterium]